MLARDSIAKFIQRKAAILLFLGSILLLLSLVDFVPFGLKSADQERALQRKEKILEDRASEKPRPTESSTDDTSEFLPWLSGKHPVHDSNPQVHPILKTKLNHGFEGKPIPREDYKLMNGRISNTLMPFSFRGGGSSYGAEVRTVEHELAESFCKLVIGKSQQHVQDLAGPPIAVVEKNYGTPGTEPSASHWFYSFGYLEYCVDVVIANGYCTKATVCDGRCSLGWRWEEAKRCSMIGKSKSEIEKLMQGSAAYESRNKDELVFLIDTTTWLEFKMNDGKCISWSPGHIWS